MGRCVDGYRNTLPVVKLRREDQEILDELKSKVKAVKGHASGSEVLGLSLRFAHSRIDEFVATASRGLEDDTILGLLRNPGEGGKTDARKVEEYLYG